MQLSIRDIVFEVFRFLWENRLDLLRMMAAPVLALSIFGIGLSALLASGTPEAEGASPSGLHVLGLFLAVALPTIFYVMFAVAWHRRCLRSEEQTTILSALRWDRRKTLFLGRFFVIALITLALALPPAVITMIVGGGTAAGLAKSGVGGPSTGLLFLQLGKTVIAVVVLLLQVRLAIWLPAAALDHKLTLMEAWVMGRRNSWRMVAILILSIAPAMLAAVLVSSAVGLFAQATGLAGTLTFRFVASLAFNFVYYIVIAASVSALSISYRELRRKPSPGTPYYV